MCDHEGEWGTGGKGICKGVTVTRDHAAKLGGEKIQEPLKRWKRGEFRDVTVSSLDSESSKKLCHLSK